MAECSRCTRTDLSLTANGRVRSHAANGKRASETNPHCPGGSDWPKHDHDFTDSPECAVCGVVTFQPTEQDVRDAELAMRAPDAPDEALSAAEEVLNMATTHGVRHVHRFEYADDDNGHSGSFCPCGEEEPTPVVGPNPHRAPVPTGWPEAKAAGWSRQGWDAYNQQGGALHQLLKEELENGSWMPTPSSTGATTPAPTTAPSSKPGTAPSATSASTGSKKETSSVGSGTETTSMPTASKTGSVSSNPATSFVNSSSAPAGSNDVPRDRWGRYLLPHPDTGRVQPWTRATTMASSIADTFALSQWSQRMVAKGITLRPDLYALASGYDVSLDKDDMNHVCDQAKTAAGDKVAANLGTAMHNFTAAVDQGLKPNIPPTMQADVDAYVDALRAYGLEIVPQMIEKRVALTSASEDVAGTFDRVYRATRDVELKMADKKVIRLTAGDHVIGDLKTGRDLSYGWGEIAIQEAIYAHGINENGIWEPENQDWNRLPLGYDDSDDGPMPRTVREDVGIVVHLPIQKKEGAPACVLYAVDLGQGWSAIQLCMQVRKWRKAKKIAAPLEIVDQPTAVPAPVDVHEHEADSALDQQQRFGGSGGAEANGQAPSPGFNRPTMAQVANHPSVAQEAAASQRPAPRKPTWEERADMVTTKAEASALYQEMRPQVQKIGQTRFNTVIKRMQDKLSKLIENAG